MFIYRPASFKVFYSDGLPLILTFSLKEVSSLVCVDSVHEVNNFPCSIEWLMNGLHSHLILPDQYFTA